MKKTLLKVYLPVTFIVLAVFTCFTGLKAQVINEGFEESLWFTGPHTGSTTSGTVGFNVPVPSSTVTFYTITNVATATSTSINNAPNTGTWIYSKGTVTTESKMGRVHSASHAWNTGNGGYLITPVVNGGIVTVTFWLAGGGSSAIQVGLNTNTNAAPPTSPAVSAQNFSIGVQGFKTAVTSYAQSFSMTASVFAPFQVGFFNASGGGAYLDDITIQVDPGTQASVSTDSETHTQTTATINGTITANNPTPNSVIISSGVCYTTSGTTLPDTSNPHTTNGISGGSFGAINSIITGLAPLTNYCVRAYAITTAGIVYGNKICFTTLATTKPSVQTLTAGIPSSTQCVVNGLLTDNGGLNISQSGFYWGTSSTLTSYKTTASGFPHTLTGLSPNTTYYFQAYATNTLGTSTGIINSFTTADSAASIYATSTALNFGSIELGAQDVVKKDTIFGRKLTPPSGSTNDSVNIAVPSGFLISLLPNTGFSSSVNVAYNYTNGVLNNTVVYIKMLSSYYGIYNGVQVASPSGGSATSDNIQYISLFGQVTASSNNYSSAGIDFWTGFGFVEQVGNSTGMSVYISAPLTQDALVSVNMPGLPSFAPTFYNKTGGQIFPPNPSKPNTIIVPAGTVVEARDFSSSDARLWYTGVSNRAIHVTSDQGIPVSVWTYLHEFGNDAAAGCLNFPTNTWNTSYIAQSLAWSSNNDNPFPYLFVIAKEDSTEVEINPTSDIIDSISQAVINTGSPYASQLVIHTKGIPFTVLLNKGQVYNALAYIPGSKTNNRPYDLSGTTINSLNCKKKIAVFGGNGRCDIGNTETPISGGGSGSDNLMQQMFPLSAWGDTYLTVPTKSMERNVYRIFVSDSTATLVNINGVILDTNTLINKSYYHIDELIDSLGNIDMLNHPNMIKGVSRNNLNKSKPISVTQFITSEATKNASMGNNGSGDPEMIILSPIKQAINYVTVYSPALKNGTAPMGNYINVIIPKNGVKSFKIYSDSSKIHAGDSTLYQDATQTPPSPPFNQLVGYGFTYRQFDDMKTIMVDTGSNSFTGIAHASDTYIISVDSAFKPHPADSNYYYAKFKVNPSTAYTLSSSEGFNAIAYGMSKGESYGFNAGTNLNIINTTPGLPYIITTVDSITHASQTDQTEIKSCLSIPFHYSIALSFKPDSLVWNFDLVGGGVNNNISPNNDQHQLFPQPSDSVKLGSDTTIKYYLFNLTNSSGSLIKYMFNQLGTYPVKVTAYSKSNANPFIDPCNVDTTGGKATNVYNFSVVVTKGVHPGFTPEYATCTTDTLYKFMDNTWDENAGTDTAFIIRRLWDFGNGKIDTANNKTVSTTYKNSGIYTVNLRAVDKIGCIYDTSVNQSIKLKPVAKFTVSADTICAGSSVTFIDQSSTVGKGILDGISTYSWNYGNGTKTFADSARRSNQYNQFGTYPVTLKVTNGVGCDSTYNFKSIFVSANPVSNFKFPNDVCLNAVTSFTNLSSIADGSSLKYVWDFGDASKKDSVNKDATHSYGGYGPYNVSLTAYNAIGCTNTTTQVFDVLYSLIPLAIGQDYQEGFESQNYNTNPNYFPPVAPNGQRWHVTQSPVDAITWDRAVDIANNIVPSEGKACTWINNFAYTGKKQQDDLNTPVFGLPKYDGIYDSLLLKFDVAAKSTAAIGDTLEVLISTDCNNWQTIYKKWGADLLTIHDGTQNTAGEFKVNDKKYWRTDSINITASTTLGGAFANILQTGGNDVRFKFRSHNNNENNIYLDNINLYVLRPNGVGFNTTTIPFDTALSIRYNYPPTDLKRLTIYDMTGRLIHVINYNNSAPRVITLRPGFNGIPYMANGMYVVVMEYVDKPKAVFNFLKQ